MKTKTHNNEHPHSIDTFFPDQATQGKQSRDGARQQQRIDGGHVWSNQRVDQKRRDSIDQKGREHPEQHHALVTVVVTHIKTGHRF
jgi:hypothetical protein